MRKPIFLVAAVLLLPAVRGVALERTVLAVPAQHALVDFAFDLADLRPRDLDLVCYAVRPADAGLALDVFDRAAWRWKPMSVAEWQQGVGLRAEMSRLVLVGSGPAVEALAAPVWAQEVRTVSGQRMADVANAVSSFLHLSPDHWHSLASAYGFQLEDRNELRRRYGRYGPPSRTRPPAETAPQPPNSFGLEPADVPALPAPAAVETGAVSAPATPESGMAAETPAAGVSAPPPAAPPSAAPPAKAAPPPAPPPPVVRPEDK